MLEKNWRVRPGRECRHCGEMRISAMTRWARKPDGVDTRCKRCSALKTRQLARRNPEREAARQRAYVAKNRDRVRAAKRRWRDANASRVATTDARYRAEHRDSIAAYKRLPAVRARQRSRNQMRRSRTLSGETFLDVEIFERDAFRCYLCGRATSLDLPPHHPSRTVLEHRVPLSRGGEHSRANTATACWECNARKGAKTEEEYKEAVKWATNQSAA